MRSALESFSSSFLSFSFFTFVNFFFFSVSPSRFTSDCFYFLLFPASLVLIGDSGHSPPPNPPPPPHLCAYPTAALSCSPFLAFPSRRIPGESLLFGTKALQAQKRAERPNRQIQATREHRWEVRGQRKINSAFSCGGLLPPRVRLSKASPSTAGSERWCVFTNRMRKKMMTAA